MCITSQQDLCREVALGFKSSDNQIDQSDCDKSEVDFRILSRWSLWSAVVSATSTSALWREISNHASKWLGTGERKAGESYIGGMVDSLETPNGTTGEATSKLARKVKIYAVQSELEKYRAS